MPSFLNAYVPTPPDPMYLTLEDLRDMATTYVSVFGSQGIDFSNDGPYTDAQALSFIAQASRKINGHIKGSLMFQLRQEDHMGSGTNFLQLRRRPIWQGTTTTLTALAHAGDTTITVADMSNFLPGQYVIFPQNEDFPLQQPTQNPFIQVGPSIDASFTPSTGPGVVQLAFALTKDHAIGEYVAINGLDSVSIKLPYSVYPLQIQSLTQRYAQGQLLIWTPLEIQLLGSSSVFPNNVPLRVQYTHGYPYNILPAEVKEACLELMIYVAAGRRYEGVKRIRSGERALEFGIPVQGIPGEICDLLSAYMQSVNFW